MAHEYVLDFILNYLLFMIKIKKKIFVNLKLYENKSTKHSFVHYYGLIVDHENK